MYNKNANNPNNMNKRNGIATKCAHTSKSTLDKTYFDVLIFPVFSYKQKVG